jgi:putative glycosyl hydrolase protein
MLQNLDSTSMIELSRGKRRPSAIPLLLRATLTRPAALMRSAALCLSVLCLALCLSTSALAAEASPAHPATAVAAPRRVQDLSVRGIYVQQPTALDAGKLRYLIDNALKVGLNTFVVDLWARSPGYAEAVKTIQTAGLSYVPRITLFPGGASPEQVNDQQLLEKRWRLVDYALKLGAKDIQLDYIRFSSRNVESEHNADKILEIVRFFRQRIAQRGARLQIDVFGEVSYGPSMRIGQDMRRFAPELDAVCPMLYPSHFEPYKETAKVPYQTVHGALLAMARQTKANPLPMYAYIEGFNYRYKMTDAERTEYLDAQVQAVLDSAARGFYVWSVGNYYDILFNVLTRRGLQRSDGAPMPDMVSGASSSGRAVGLPMGPPLAPELGAGPAPAD